MLQVGSGTFQIDQSTALAFGAGFGLIYISFRFVIGWAAKHILDATVLPPIRGGIARLRDRWARRNRETATKRAQQYLDYYSGELAAESDPRIMALRVETRVSSLVGFHATTSGICVSLLLLWLSTDDGQPKALTAMLVVALLIGTFGYTMESNARDLRRRERELLNPEERRSKVIERLRSILGEKLSEAEVQEWIAKVPELPSKVSAAEPPKPAPPQPALDAVAPQPASPSDKKSSITLPELARQVELNALTHPSAVFASPDVARALASTSRSGDATALLSASDRLLGRTNPLLRVGERKKE